MTASGPSQGLRAHERIAWDALRRLMPGYDAALNITHPDPPDVIFELGGRHIGVELVSWIDQGQIETARPREDFRRDFEQTLRVERPSAPARLGSVAIDLRPGGQPPMTEPDRRRFRDEFYRLCEDVNARWVNGRLANGPQGYICKDLAAYPALKQFVERVRFKGGEYRRTDAWAYVAYDGGAYSTAPMVDALVAQIHGKHAKPAYPGLKKAKRLDQLDLVVHYDMRAFRYNSPAEGHRLPFRDLPDLLGPSLAGLDPTFDNIYLVNCIPGDEQIVKLR